MEKTKDILGIRKRPFKVIWTLEEDNVLFSMAGKNKKKSWKIISIILKNKTPSQCFYRFFSKKNILIKKDWSTDEDKLIKDYVKIYGKKWDEISKKFSTRTSREIKERYINKLDLCLKTSKFTIEEDHKILSNFFKYGTKWSFISKKILGRTPNMIKSRFYCTLKNKIMINQKNNDFYLEKKNVN